MKACPQMSYDLVFQNKEGAILSYHIFRKYQKFCKKLTFDLSKFKFQNGLTPTNTFLGLFKTNHFAAAQPNKSLLLFCRFQTVYKMRRFWHLS